MPVRKAFFVLVLVRADSLVRGDTPLKTCQCASVWQILFIFGISKPLCVAGCLTHRELEGRFYDP